MRRYSLIFLCISLFCGLFSAVYEYFSHGVYSGYMVYLFLFPFAGGVLPYAGFGLFPNVPCPQKLARNLYNSGIATLAAGSCVKGVLDIYGTTSIYCTVYWLAGAVLTAAGFAAYLIGSAKAGKSRA
ncbi:MAG: hypothetical protein VB064_01595 [Oscillospiraceae bacterium]|nr:hypothetical protein [Oscillospiraceae bacterium]